MEPTQQNEIRIDVRPSHNDIVVNLNSLEIIAVASGNQDLLDKARWLKEWAVKNRCFE